MSATIQEPERVSSFTSTKSGRSTYSRSSVYQTNGKPLSEEAIYKAKLKYGVYNKPGAPMLGVTHSASDSAALLAAQTDLTIHPYKRNLSAEAATAALIAKTDTAPKAWKREGFAPDAEYAAISARSMKYPFNNGVAHDEKESSEAASSVLKKSSSTIAREALEDLYAFDEIRNGHQTFTKFDGQSLKNALERSVADNLSKRTNPTLDYRSGLTTKSSLMKMNMGAIHKQSSLNASKSMTSRVSPNHDSSRAGLYTSRLNTSTGAVNISKINIAANAKARSDVLRRLDTSIRDYRRGIPTASDVNTNTLASSGADLSLHNTKFGDYASYERDSLLHNTLVDKKVYAYATANVDKALHRIADEQEKNNLFHNREMNLKAMQIAQANSQKRSETSNKINLGGGLFMDPQELQVLAASIVKPVLTDIDNKASAQRKTDFDRAKLHEDQKQKKILYKEEQRRKKQEAIQEKEEEKRRKKAELEKKKELQKTKQKELTKKKVGEVDGKGEELNKQTQEHDAAKEVILGEKLETEQQIALAELEKKTARDAELKLIQDEKDADVAPILEEYNKETAILDDLIAKRETAEKLAQEQHERAEKAEADLKELTDKLEETNTQIATLKEELTTKKSDSERHTQEAELLKKESEAEVQSKQVQEQEFITNNEKLKYQKVDLQTKRSSALVSLQEAKKAALLDELAINSALPEHLQKDVNQDLTDESDLDEDQFNTSEEEPEPKTDNEGEEEESGDVEPTAKTAKGREVTIAAAGSVDAANVEAKDKDPKSINPHHVKSLVDVVDSDISKLPKSTAVRRSAPPPLKKTTVSSPSKKTGGGWKSKMKSMLGTNTSSASPERKKVVTKTVITTKLKPVKKLSSSKPVASSGAPVTKDQISNPVPIAGTKKDSTPASENDDDDDDEEETNDLQQTFSGFSQGSIPEKEEGEEKKGEGEENDGEKLADDEHANGSVLKEEKSQQKESLFKEDI